jgi:antitoxin component of MazEF toxin-antitoxin module
MMHDHKDQTHFDRLIRAAQRVVKRGKNAKDELVSEELIRDRRRECAQESLEDLLQGVTPDNRHPLIEPGPDVGKEIISDE